MRGTIKFFGNPWPDGHQIKTLRLAVSLRETGEAFVALKLESEDYHYPKSWEEACDESEAQFKANPDLDNWEGMASWNNYHACHFDTASSHPDLALDIDRGADPKFILDGFDRHIDPTEKIDPEADDYFDARAICHCYILGHDMIADHKIHLVGERTTGLYAMTWSGKYANAYVGDHTFSRDFLVDATNVPFYGYQGFFKNDDRRDASLEYREKKLRDLAGKFFNDTKGLKFIAGDRSFSDRLAPDLP